jgi:hypothetical protein
MTAQLVPGVPMSSETRLRDGFGAAAAEVVAMVVDADHRARLRAVLPRVHDHAYGALTVVPATTSAAPTTGEQTSAVRKASS